MSNIEQTDQRYRRDITITVNRSREHPDTLVAVLSICDYRDGKPLNALLHEGYRSKSLAAVRHKLAHLHRLVHVCDIDDEQPANKHLVPLHMTWDIQLDLDAPASLSQTTLRAGDAA